MNKVWFTLLRNHTIIFIFVLLSKLVGQSNSFFIVLNGDSNAIGYIDEYDIDFESENIKDKIKEYSSNNFLDSKSLME